MTVNWSLKSIELLRKVPPWCLMMADLRTFWTLFGMGLAVLSLHGPVVGRPDYNGLRYLLGPWLCPSAGVAYYFLRPFNPYDCDAQDPDAERLIEVFRSMEARQFLLRAMLKISIRLFGIMLLLAMLHWNSLTWTLTSFWLAPGLLVGSFASMVILGSEFIDWGLRRWTADSRGEDSM